MTSVTGRVTQVSELAMAREGPRIRLSGSAITDGLPEHPPCRPTTGSQVGATEGGIGLPRGIAQRSAGAGETPETTALAAVALRTARSGVARHRPAINGDAPVVVMTTEVL